MVWLARLKRGLRPGEGPALLAWLERRSHRNAIARAAVEWHGPEVLAVLSEIFPIPPAILEPPRRPHATLLAAGAFVIAGITVVIPTAIILWTGMHGHVYATAPETTQRLALEDGTRVALNRGTQITVIYAVRARSVQVMRGEALFRVASEPGRPFYVHAAGRSFETASATFDVRFAAPQQLSLTVLEGTVTVFPPAPLRRPSAGRKERVFDSRLRQPILLEPLQMLVIGPDEEFGQTLTEESVRSRLAWEKGT